MSVDTKESSILKDFEIPTGSDESADGLLSECESESESENQLAYLIGDAYEGTIEFNKLYNNKELYISSGVYSVDLKTLYKFSALVRDILKNDSVADNVFVVRNESNISSDKVVSKMAEWINYHANGKIPPITGSDHQPIRSSNYKIVLRDIGVNVDDINWYANFMSMNVKVFVDLMTSCNYMNMSNVKNSHGGLMNYCCLKMATIIKGHSPQELEIILDEKKDIPISES